MVTSICHPKLESDSGQLSIFHVRRCSAPNRSQGSKRRKKNESDGPLVHSFLGVFAAEILLTESRVRILAGDDDYSAL